MIDSHAVRSAPPGQRRANLALLIFLIAALAVACGPGGSTAAPGATSGVGTPATAAPTAPGY